jgi:hypothetical protein
MNFASLALLLATGPTVVAERGVEPGRFCVAVAGFGTRESPERQGLRHLVEHLAALGPKGDADQRLERLGAFLEAETTRTYVMLSVGGPMTAFEEGLAVLAECVSQPVAAAADRERRLIVEEAALRSPAQHHAGAAWAAAYGAPDPAVLGADPLPTAEALTLLHVRTFAAGVLAVCIVADTDPAEAEAKARAAFSTVPAGPADSSTAYPEALLGASATAAAPGSSRAAPILPLGTGDSLATVAAGLALRRALPGTSLLATPSFEAGMVTLWSPKPQWEALDRDAQTLAAPQAAAARHELAAWLWPSDTAGRARSWARLGGGTGVRSPRSLAELALSLAPSEVARRAESFAEPLAVQVRGR